MSDQRLSAAVPSQADLRTDPQSPGEHFERPTRFGRVRWWYEESPMALTASAALFLVIAGFFWLFSVRQLQADTPIMAVSLQAVQAETPEPAGADALEGQMQELGLAGEAGEPVEREELDEVSLPEIPPVEKPLDVEQLIGNQEESQLEIEKTRQQLTQAGEMLKKLLGRAQTRGAGDSTSGGAGRGVGQLDPNSTPGRQARWVITYPTLPQGEYERMLDSLGIELAYLQPDRTTMQYLGNLSGAGRKYAGDASAERRMWWFWMGSNRLRALDDAIMRRHGLEPTSEVVQLYPKQMEQYLAELEKQLLLRKYKTKDVNRVAQTNFKVERGGRGGWHIEVAGLGLR